jgi:predicted nuclease of restriction endonuclease-like (RecB) superfamily
MIVERQEELGWGSAVVDQLSADLRNEFPEMSGFLPRNFWDIKRFYVTYSAASEFLQQFVAEIPWGQNILYVLTGKYIAA